jgi:protein phosphatase
MPKHDEETVEMQASDRFAKKFFAPVLPVMRNESGAASHVGKVRQNNEDHYAVVKRRRVNEALLTNLSPDDLVLTDDSAFGMVVADGMGGASFGELASGLAIARMFELGRQASSWVMKYVDLDAQQIRDRVDAYVHEIQATMREHIQANPALAGMGTTWTSAHLLPPHALVVHMGDSRAYLLHRGNLQQVTRDDTVAQACIDAGMDPDSVKKFRHLVMNNLGDNAYDVIAHIYELEIEPGDKLLLCTDGLTGMVADGEIARILQDASTAQGACDQLISAALEQGGKDNVTAVVAYVAAEAVSNMADG